ncbi:hypothetical protein [Streptomyces sp. Ncost-T6T-1]|uniref:hypothetical protein n=1 Tax=Streptomyces sp. Ncost-T6T-1 TaxID=1100828 RepID=UPI0011476377|nr:hypothetical protein [Streptomyces sp. Ncost-T6T-1]
MSINLLLDEQGGGDVSGLLLQPMLEGDEGCLAVVAVCFGTDLPTDPDEARPPALVGEGQDLAWSLACAGLKVHSEAER